jgi:hypothetical protein
MNLMPVTTSATKIANANAVRRGVILQVGSADVYVSFCGDNGVTVEKGFLIEADSPPIFLGNMLARPGAGALGYPDGWPDEIWAVAAGETNVKVEEVP